MKRRPDRMPSQLIFGHRHNDDGTWDSICKTCFLTVATAPSEDELPVLERNHDCAELWVSKRIAISEISQTFLQ